MYEYKCIEKKLLTPNSNREIKEEIKLLEKELNYLAESGWKLILKLEPSHNTEDYEILIFERTKQNPLE
ncbi:DUF4177 domain-containing protein [Clostridium sp. B9]|uniref:DUF4177 domain-containing protein n=1 Tax=Clostridium sp. B9 TaxID=3423224 RepID=UPI003D2F38D4